MTLWIEWTKWVNELRKACSHLRTFMWMVLVLAAMSMRAELLAVTSFIRASFLHERCYRLLLNFFHSKALDTQVLCKLWINLILKLFTPVIHDGFIIMLADGLKVPKEGRKMPGVKSLHQESAKNSKPEYIMGHSFQAIALLIHGRGEQMFALPIISRICEGINYLYSKKDITLSLGQKVIVLHITRPLGSLVRFVLVKHPSRGKIILLCTNLEVDPLTIIKLYGLRFKIEVSFKQALHTIGSYSYHFWMMPMKPIKQGQGDQNLSFAPEKYKQAVRRKMGAYHRYVHLACIAQGLLQSLAVNYRKTLWDKFRSWLRTMKTDLIPSEMVVAQALRASFPDFLLTASYVCDLKKFILDNADYDRLPGFSLAA